MRLLDRWIVRECQLLEIAETESRRCRWQATGRRSTDAFLLHQIDWLLEQDSVGGLFDGQRLLVRNGLDRLRPAHKRLSVDASLSCRNGAAASQQQCWQGEPECLHVRHEVPLIGSRSTPYDRQHQQTGKRPASPVRLAQYQAHWNTDQLQETAARTRQRLPLGLLFDGRFG
ncbi:hypothetical protein [Posidoniimonas corsicana]|uniref:hypothetical protein n=1 Tax=Posidoniimonas corsicana TaxID=1938618 RepID=UPI0018D38D0A|nr:hypothetical protein [Posidoniimonas corsicana]